MDEGILLGYALGEVRGSTIAADDETEIVSSDGTFDGDSDAMLEVSRLAVTLGSTDGEALRLDEGILLGSAFG